MAQEIREQWAYAPVVVSGCVGGSDSRWYDPKERIAGGTIRKRQFGMDHWSDDGGDARNESARTDAVDVKNHEMIAAILPDFWESVIQCVQADAKAVAKNQGHACECIVLPAGQRLTITRKVAPPRTLVAMPNILGHYLKLVKALDLDTTGQPQRPFEEERIHFVIKDDGLEFHCAGRPCRTPAELSRYFFAFVCEKDWWIG